MGSSRFSVLLSLRLCVVLGGLVLLALFLSKPGYHASAFLTACAVAIMVFELVRFVHKTNQELVRFLDAARYADFGQRFTLGERGSGFDELGEAFSSILERFRDYRSQQEVELRHFKALVEHVPVPLLSAHADGRVELWNNAARRLFGMVNVTRVEDLELFGTDLAEHVRAAEVGDKRLVSFTMESSERSLTMAVSQLVIDGAPERLISLQDIQSELDETQVNAWQDLVRVLTHEIMNSITPVASLARTAVDLVEDLAPRVADNAELSDELKNLRDAVGTVASRSDGLIKFVSSYRRLTRLPPPTKSLFQVADLFAEVTRLATVNWERERLTLSSSVEPGHLELFADREMVEQILLNIVQNCEHALAESARGEITLQARLSRRGHVMLEVADNGPGVPEELRSRIFVPFYTTKREGSGVGLALARQVMIAHGGTIAVSSSATDGARFTLAL